MNGLTKVGAKLWTLMNLKLQLRHSYRAWVRNRESYAILSKVLLLKNLVLINTWLFFDFLIIVHDIKLLI